MNYMKLLGCLCLVFFLSTAETRAAVFTPSTSEDFQDALTTAQANGEDDTITLAAGTYSVDGPFTYGSDGETYAITITGAGGGSTIITNTSGNGIGLEMEVGGAVTISGITFADCSTTGLYISADSFGGDLIVDINNSVFSGNARGLSIINGHLLGEVTLDGNQFSQNEMNSSGAGLQVISAVLGVNFPINISNNTFEENITTSSGNGAGAYISVTTEGSSVGLYGNEFSGNQADGEGGGIYVVTNGEGSDIVIGDPGGDGNTFDGNGAGGSGGGFYARTYDDNTEIKVIENEFVGNVSGNQGGGFLADIDGAGDSLLTVTDNVIGTEGVGGNSADDSGGGAHMFARRGLLLEDNTVDNNDALYGAGLSVIIDGTGTNTAAHTISGNTLTGNVATGDVGGLDVQADFAGTLLIDGNLSTLNESGGEGGGGRLLLYAAGDEVVVTNNIFYDNTAVDQSGGFDFYGTASVGLDFIHNTVLSNAAVNAGGANFGLDDASATYNIYDNIFWGNSLTGVGNGADVQLEMSGWDVTNFEYNSVGNDDNDFCISSGGVTCPPTDGIVSDYNQDNLFYGDPEFDVSPAYELTPQSPLLNVGYATLDNFPDFDYSGNARIYGDASDLGAMELQEAAAPEEEEEESSRRRSSHRRPIVKTAPSPIPELASTSVHVFTRDLWVGDQGDDVRALQLLLIAKNAGPAAAALAQIGATGYFGEYTRAAVAELQELLGVKPTAGYFGPLTRGALWL